MLIKVLDHEQIINLANSRIKVLEQKLQEAQEEKDIVSSEAIKNAIDHIKTIRKAAKAEFEIFLDEDDRFVLGL